MHYKKNTIHKTTPRYIQYRIQKNTIEKTEIIV